MAAIGTAIATANGLFIGHPSLAYWFWGASFALIALAILGSVVNSKPEKKTDHPSPTPPVEVRQENKQIVSQNFSPQIHFGIQDDASVTAKLERTRQERAILDFLKRSEHRFYEIRELANATGISKPNTRAALERLEAQKSVWKVGAFDIEGGYAWKLDDLELDDKQ